MAVAPFFAACALSVGCDASLNCCDATGLSGSSSPDSTNDLLRRFILQEEGRDILTPSPSKEIYSRKVFLGGLPPDIDEGDYLITLRENQQTSDYVHILYFFNLNTRQFACIFQGHDDLKTHKLSCF